MMWQLQQAKSKFSQLVKDAKHYGPQQVSVHGVPEVVVMSIEDYQKYQGAKKSIYEFFHQSPLVEMQAELKQVLSERERFDRDIGDLA